eukprot:366343-Chlamydomonas_euryale.AAC.4
MQAASTHEQHMCTHARMHACMRATSTHVAHVASRWCTGALVRSIARHSDVQPTLASMHVLG